MKDYSQVVVIGDAMINQHYWVDTYPASGGDAAIKASSRGIGGSGVSTAIALALLGIDTAYAGCVGDDADGRWILEEIRSTGLNLDAVQLRERTGAVVSVIDSAGERTMFSDRGIVTAYALNDHLTDKVKSAKILHISSYCLLEEAEAQSVIALAKEAKESGVLVSLDTIPNILSVKEDRFTEMLQFVDILLPNRQELLEITKTADYKDALSIMEKKVPCIALKLGSRGALVSVRQGFGLPSGKKLGADIIVESPAAAAAVIDTTGAGDAFNAGFLSSILQSDDPVDWAKRGNEIAGKVVAVKEAHLPIK